MSNNYFIIPIFVPHLGCPHDCVFCNQRRITGLSTNVTSEDVERIIEEHLATFPKNENRIEVAFYGGSFTGIDESIQRELLSIPLKYKNKNKIHGIRLSTRPDYIDENILNLLKEYKVDTIELGVQSLADDVLKKSGRGHNSQQVYDASQLIKKYDFNLGLQMMIGLIGDSKEKSIYTAKEFIKLEPYCVRIYPTLVIRDTYLEKLYKEQRYEPLSLNEAVNISRDLLMLFEYYNIHVIRVGLQPTENITLGKDVIAGPFHPSFRQLVESSIYRLILDNFLDNHKELIKNNIIKIKTNKKNISNIVGQKSSNKRYFINKYKLKNIKIYEEDISLDDIILTIGNFDYTINKKNVIKKYLKDKFII